MKTVLLLLPVILSNLLFAAHVMRDHGPVRALAVVALLTTLFVTNPWVRRIWMGLPLVAIVEWVRTAVLLVELRMAYDQPYLRLAMILGLVVALNGVAIYVLSGGHLKARYGGDTG